MRLGALGIVGLGLIGFFVFLMARLGSTDMALLYADLDPTESRQILTQLDTSGVPYEIQQNGTQILVPASEVAQVRIRMAEQGLPSSGSMGYELFDQSDGLGTSNFVQNINRVRALEGELARTISAIQGIQAARVHLVLPQRELFTRERQKPSASIYLKLGRASLGNEEIQAIQHLVASSVPDLRPSEVAVIDNRGRLLASGTDDSEQVALRNAESMRRNYEQRLAQEVQALVERTAGIGKVRVEVAADLDFDRITENSELYDPDSQVVRSTQTIEESSSTSEVNQTDEVTVQNNLPEGVEGQNPDLPRDTSQQARTEETTNFEISRVVKTLVRETGIVNRLSVAVLVDGTYAEAPDGGTPTYQPRDQQFLDNVETLVESAIGYNAGRGDTVQVVNMRFAPLDTGFDVEPSTLFGLTKEDFLNLAEIIVLAVVGLLVLLLVVRPVLARLFETVPTTAEAVLGGGALGAPGAHQIAGPGGEFDMAQLAPPEEQEEDSIDQMIDISRVEGRVRASSLRKIGEIVEKHPEEAVAIIRNWMYQDSSAS